MSDLSKYGPPRTDATAQLLLLLARDKLSETQRQRVNELAPLVPDWIELLKLATRNAGLPFVYKHMSGQLRAILSPDMMAEIKALALRQTLAAMKLTSSLCKFHQDCLVPSGASYLFMKGPALAVQYYQDTALRTSCDIDVLIAERDFERVARTALSQGYRFLFQTEDGDFATKEQDIAFLIRYAECISAFSPDGTHFELHRHIEKTTPIFPADAILESALNVRVGTQVVKTMSHAWHFIYITYHHSRHFWSRLHWVADLHALTQHDSFNEAEVLGLATKIGILPTVQAALDFAKLTDTPSNWPSVLGKTPGGIFLDACLRGLPGDHAFELESWDAMFLFDFGDQWQFDAKKKYRFWAQSALRRLKPNEYQYKEKPRPRAMEWLYYVENAVILSDNAFKHLGPKS
jgi:Uncharacterised nucleotidyltransferase